MCSIFLFFKGFFVSIFVTQDNFIHLGELVLLIPPFHSSPDPFSSLKSLPSCFLLSLFYLLFKFCMFWVSHVRSCFKEQLRFTAKLSGRYRVPTYPLPLLDRALSSTNATDEPPLTQQYHQECTAYLGAHSWNYPFCDCGEMYDDLSIILVSYRVISLP